MKKIIACFCRGGGNPLNYLCAVLLALALAPSAFGAPQYKAALTIQGYSGSSTLENFPVLVRLSPQTVEGFSYSACASGGADISFTAADGETVLPHEIDTWNTSGESLVWVKLPSLSGTDTVFNFRWADDAPPSVTSSDVWSGANFKSVWHMKFDSNNKTADAVANYEGSIINKNAYCGERDSIVGAGYYCEDNRANHHGVKTTEVDGFAPATSGAATYSAWVRQVGGTCAKGYPDSVNYPQIYWSSTWGNCGAIWNSKNGNTSGNNGIELCLEGKANVINQMYVRDTTASLKTLTIPNIFDKQWHYLVVAYDGTNRRFYLDGVLQENFNLAATVSKPSGTVYMGERKDNKDCVWTGDLDEMRFRAAASSADWVAAEYANVTDAAFIAYGAAQAGDGTVWVKGSPENYGSPTPAYGFQTGYAAGDEVSFSMPATAVAGEGTVTNYLVGWRFESVDQTTQARTTIASSDDQGASLDSYSGTYASYSEFTWLWDVRDTLGVGGITIAANGGTYLDLAVDVTGLGYAAGGSATLTVAYGLAEDDLDATVSTNVDMRGAATVRVNRLQPNTPYYFQATLDDGESAPVQSAVVALSTSALTTGFRRIEYVEGTGTQWIDTGYLPTPTTRTVADFQFTTVEKTKRAFGVGVGNLYYDTFINNTGSGQWGYSRADSSSEKAVSGNVAVDTERHLIDFNYDNGDGGRALAIYSTNGTVTASQAALEGSATRNATYPLAIGATRAKETASSTDKDTVAGNISKHRIYSVNIYEGDALEFALAPIRNDSGAVMFYDSVAKKFFASAGTMQTDLAYTDGGPSVETGQAVQNGTRVITLSFLGAPMERPLYLAYGPSFAGDDPADWATREFVKNIPAGETSATVPFPATWGEDSAFVARCYFDDGTTFPLWSDPVVWQDDSALVMSGVAVDGTGGDTLVVSGTLESFPGDECTLTVYVGADADHLDVAWTGLAGAVRSDIGAFSLTLYESDTTSPRYITPGTNLYVAVEATAGTKTVRSAAIPVTTKGAPVFETASVSGVSHNRITVSGTLVDLGAGNSATVTLYVGETNDENALVAVEEDPVVRTATGDFPIAHNFAACGKTYYVQLRAVATTTGGTPIETRTAVLSAMTQDTTTYTWRAVDGDWNGDWEDSAHWKTDKTPNLGYPQTAQCKASFADCTTNNPVVVTVNGKYQVSYLKYYGSSASDVTLAGNGATDSQITAGGVAHNANNNKSNLKAGTSITFKDLTLVRDGDWDLIRDVSTSNLTYRFEGVTTTGSGRFCVAVPAARIEFIDSSVTGRSNVMNFGGGGTVVVVDNSTLDNSGQSITFQADVPAASRGPMELTIRGTNTVITCKEFFIYNHATGNGVTINFEVPKGGFVSTPITVAGSAFGNNSNADSTAKFAFAVAEDSPALTRDGVIENNVLVQTANGFGTSRMADPLGTVPEYEGVAQGAFKYGVGGAATADTTAARQILLDLQGHSSAVRGTMFLVW